MILSIIIPVFNMSRELNELLADLTSIIQKNQLFNEIEIIIVDDGSTDRAFEVCHNYVEKYLFVKVIKMDHSGVSSARNRGMEVSCGDFVFFCDADDRIIPTGFLKGFDTLKNNSILYDAFIFPYEYETNEKDCKVHQYTEEEMETDASSAITLLIKSGGNTVWGKFFRRSIIQKYHIEFPDIKIHEDVVFLYRFIIKTSRNLFLSYPIYHYYYNTTGSLRTISIDHVIGYSVAFTTIRSIIGSTVDDGRLLIWIEKIYYSKIKDLIKQLQNCSYADENVCDDRIN